MAIHDSFLFIDGVNADSASKKKSRQHVMKGKNVGKKYKRQSRSALQLKRPQSIVPVPNAPQALENSIVTGFPFPVEVSPFAMGIINDFFEMTATRMYPVQLGMSLDVLKSVWLQTLFSDASSFDCSLALMQVSNEIFIGNGHASANALYHTSQVLARVKRRLESSDALADSTIAIVVSLINQEQIQQHHTAAEVHVLGLKRIVDLRGGLENLQSNTHLALKIAKTDIMFALQHGGNALFFRDRFAETEAALHRQHGLRIGRKSYIYSVRHNLLDSAIQKVLLDIMGICWLFNANPGSSPIDLFEFQEIIVSIMYRLLRSRTLLECKRQADLDCAHHIGLVVFMMTIFLQYDHRRAIKYHLISPCLEECLNYGLDKEEDELAFWLMVMGGIWLSADSEGDWVHPRLATLACKLNLKNWEQGRDVLGKFPWIGSIHDEPGRRLWERVHSHPRLTLPTCENGLSFMPDVGVAARGQSRTQ